MGKMIDGVWRTDTWVRDQGGHFKRENTTFRDRITADGSSGYAPQAGRYHLYVSYACPWANRTLIMRSLKGLEDAISVSVVHPFMGDDGWHFDESYPGSTPDHVGGKKLLREVYAEADPKFTGRVTVPVLWDRERATIVNNESREIVRMLDTQFDAIAGDTVDLYPQGYREEVDRVIDAIYEPINNGVYRSGFATSQEAYEQALAELFEALDHWEGVLAEQRYLCGEVLTEADINMFVTLVRFDPVYYSHFKCNVRRIVDYPNLWNYVKDLYQTPGFGKNVNLDHVKHHYYRSHPTINPTRVVPVGPEVNFEAPHDRDRLPGRIVRK